MEKRIYLSPPHMGGNEQKFIQEAFDSNWIAPLGPNVDAFENEICKYLGVKHALALSSGTAGIHLALKYLGVSEGDYVFCSSLTFSGTCNPILYEKGIPVFIDSEPDTWNMSPKALENALSWAKNEGIKPKAVIIVDLYGQSADYDKLLPICEAYSVPVIEDAAEALGATFLNKKCGSFGEFSVLSFNGNKIITTSGGGMVVSDNEEAIKKMRFWASQSREPARYYEHKELGYNYRMSNVCAGIGRGQMEVIDKRVIARKQIFERYRTSFNGFPLELMPIYYEGTPNYWLSVGVIQRNANIDPNKIITALENENVEARPVWKPMHKQPIFKQYPFFSYDDNGIFSDDLFERGICLPSGSSLSEEDQGRIIDIIIRIIEKES